MIAPSIVAGLGASAAIPTSANAVVGAVSIEAVGKAAGANGMLRELGGVFGIAVAVAVFAGAGSYASAAAFSDGFAAALGVAAALSMAGAVTGLALPARRASEPTNDKESGNDQLPGRVARVQDGA
jgi:membrane protein implicated in regulation of membrane protease activity